MTASVYEVEIVGTSSESRERAAAVAVERAGGLRPAQRGGRNGRPSAAGAAVCRPPATRAGTRTVAR